MLLEFNTAGVLTKRYVAGPGVDEPLVWYEGSTTTDRRWLHADERGSVVAVSDGAGAMLGINRYDEYGIPQSSNVGRFGYTGQTWIPELGLWHYKARAYSPTLGRFMQTDPIGYGDGLNWYNYVGGDPVNFRDPTGLEIEERVNGIIYRVACGAMGDDEVTCSWQAVGTYYDPGSVQTILSRLVVIELPSDSGWTADVPCSKLQKDGQAIGNKLTNVGGTVSQLAAAGEVVGGTIVVGSAVTGQPEGVAIGTLIAGGAAQVGTYASLVTLSGAAISLASGSGKPATVRLLQDALTSRMPNGALRSTARQAISAAANKIIPEWGKCR